VLDLLHDVIAVRLFHDLCFRIHVPGTTAKRDESARIASYSGAVR
jgi:hypothetical protein